MGGRGLGWKARGEPARPLCLLAEPCDDDPALSGHALGRGEAYDAPPGRRTGVVRRARRERLGAGPILARLTLAGFILAGPTIGATRAVDSPEAMRDPPRATQAFEAVRARLEHDARADAAREAIASLLSDIKLTPIATRDPPAPR